MALLVIFGIAVIISHLSILEEDPSLQQCPREMSGPEDADLRIQYFDSPFCFYCHIQKPSMDKIATLHNDSVRLERYDVRYCKESAKEYGVYATPGFVFHVTDEEKEISDATKVHMGMISKDKLEQIVCDVTHDCEGS